MGFNSFSKCLKFFPNLEELNLYSNPNDFKSIANNLRFIPKLKRLDLSCICYYNNY